MNKLEEIRSSAIGVVRDGNVGYQPGLRINGSVDAIVLSNESFDFLLRAVEQLGTWSKLLSKKYNDSLVLHYVHGGGTVDLELKAVWDNLDNDIRELVINE